MDEIDRAIVAALQKDGRLSNQDLAALVGLTSAPCLRRLRKLEERGIIKGYRAIVDQAALDPGGGPGGGDGLQGSGGAVGGCHLGWWDGAQ